MADIELHLIDPCHGDADAARAELTDAERAQADRFVFPHDARRWTIFRAEVKRRLARRLGIPVAAIDWQAGEHGKPFLAHRDLHFNLSHTNDRAALVIGSCGPLGVDLERLDRGHGLIGCEHGFCHPDEIRDLPDDPDQRATELIALWTRKEAVLKALGTGFSQAPQEVLVACDEAHGPVAGIERLHLLQPEIAGLEEYALAIAAPREVFGWMLVE